ncbi:MAG: TrmH family RNA methyltransferase, partial [Cyanobacteria bacterium P01_D01_bin.73]
FEISDRHLKRAGLDYWPHVKLTYHSDWDTFDRHQTPLEGRRIGFSVRGTENYHQFAFQENDWLLMGSETDGLSETSLASCDHLVRIPINSTHVRSLNLSVSAAVGLFEARRQLGLCD